MLSSPRIYRVVPDGPVVEAPAPIAVVVAMPWVMSEPSDVEGFAVAWTRTAVQVEWSWQGSPRRDWVAASHVRRPGQPPRPPSPGDGPPRLDTRRSRW
jgi:hypothetical protein